MAAMNDYDDYGDVDDFGEYDDYLDLQQQENPAYLEGGSLRGGCGIRGGAYSGGCNMQGAGNYRHCVKRRGRKCVGWAPNAVQGQYEPPTYPPDWTGKRRLNTGTAKNKAAARDNPYLQFLSILRKQAKPFLISNPTIAFDVKGAANLYRNGVAEYYGINRTFPKISDRDLPFKQRAYGKVPLYKQVQIPVSPRNAQGKGDYY